MVTGAEKKKLDEDWRQVTVVVTGDSWCGELLLSPKILDSVLPVSMASMAVVFLLVCYQ